MDPVVIEVFKQFGAPVAIIIVMLIFGKKLGSWTIEHVVTPVVKAHIEFLTETKQSIKVMADNLTEMKTLIVATREEVSELRKRLDDNKTASILERIEALEKNTE